MPCHATTKRPSASASTGSISCRSLASDRRRRLRRTSASTHSRSVPPGRNSPSISRSSAVSRRSSGFGDGEAEPVARGQLARR